MTGARWLSWWMLARHGFFAVLGASAGFAWGFTLIVLASFGHPWVFVAMAFSWLLVIPAFFVDLKRSSDNVAEGTGRVSFEMTVFVLGLGAAAAWPIFTVIK